MPPINFSQAQFLRSAAEPDQFLKSSIKSVVFAGKSNVGKSSVINCLLNRKNFARVGNTPGKTVHVNYFLIGGSLYFVDLPGYGFARVGKEEKERWGQLMEAFFASPDGIDLGVLIVDIRHDPTADDVMMADTFRNLQIPFVVLANKADKLGKSELPGNIDRIRETLRLSDDTPLIPFSAQKGTGRELLIAKIRNLC